MSEILPEEYSENLNKFFTALSQTYKSAEEGYKKELQHFFEVLGTQYRIVKKVEDEFNYRFGIKFNLVEIFKPDEERISGIIAELLKPNGSHGQREVFLKQFLRKISDEIDKVKTQREEENWLRKEYKWDEIEIATEVDIEKGRIDILIKLSDSGAIAIENKPWAGEQGSQLQRYVDYLENKYGREKKNYLLIFLTTEGRKPESLDNKKREELEKAGKFVVLSYNKFLKNWLKECIKLCEAEKVRTFLKDFITWIEKYFPENNFSKE